MNRLKPTLPRLSCRAACSLPVGHGFCYIPCLTEELPMTAALDPETATEGLLHAQFGVIVLNAHRRLTWLNPAAEQLLGSASDQLVCHNVDTVPAHLRAVRFSPAGARRRGARGRRPGRGRRAGRTTHD